MTDDAQGSAKADRGRPGRVRVGVSGWRYPRWRGDFYPRGLPQRRELEFIGDRFSTIELNGSFYSLQRPSSYRRWADSVPEDFVFAVKGSRYVTHMLRLRDVDTALANFFASGVLALGAKLGPILWQFPERLSFEPEVLSSFLASLPRSTGEALAMARRHDERVDGRDWLAIVEDVPLHHAIEPRSPSFGGPEGVDLLRAHGASLVIADTAGRWPRFDALTANPVYVRLHGAEELYHSRYGENALRTWARDVRGWAEGTVDGRPRDVYVYFDNDALGHAPHDAMALAALVGDAGVGRGVVSLPGRAPGADRA